MQHRFCAAPACDHPVARDSPTAAYCRRHAHRAAAPGALRRVLRKIRR